MARFAPLFALLILVAVAGSALAASETKSADADAPSDAECEAAAEQAARPPSASVEVTIGADVPRIGIAERALQYLAIDGASAPQPSADESSACYVRTDGSVTCAGATPSAKTG